MKQKLLRFTAFVIAVLCAFALSACDSDALDGLLGGDNNTAEEGNPEESKPDEGNPDEGNPDEGSPDEGSPDEGTPEEGTPEEGTPDEGTPDEGTPDEGTPEIPAGTEVAELGGKTPLECYTASLEALKTLADFTYTFGENSVVTSEGDTTENESYYEISYDVDKYYVNNNNGNETWYENGMIYYNSEDGKRKEKMTQEKFLEKYGYENAKSLTEDAHLYNIPDEWFADAVFVANENGDFCVKFEVSKEECQSAFPEGTFSFVFTYANACALTYELTFDKDGTLNNITATVDYKFKFNNVEYITDYTYKSYAVFSNIGTTSVELPEGAEDWTSPPSYDYNWEKTEIRIEYNNHSNSGELTSGCERYYAGAAANANKDIDRDIRKRNQNAAAAANVTVKADYLPEGNVANGWGRNITRIVNYAMSGDEANPDIYVNFAYDLTIAQLRGVFANLKEPSYANGNYFRFNEEDYDTIPPSSLEEYFDADAGEGYFYSYMESLSLSDDKMYILASNYTFDVIRAMAVVPVNVAMMNAITADKTWTGEAGIDNFYDLVWRDETKINIVIDEIKERYEQGWTYDVLAYYSQNVFKDANKDTPLADTLGFIAGTTSGLASSALLYSTDVEIITKTPQADNPGQYTYTYPANNAKLDTFATALTGLFNKVDNGIITVNGDAARAYDTGAATDLQMIRNKFAKNELLFGGITMLGDFEDTVYQAMRVGGGEGFGFVPIPLYSGCDASGNPMEYKTYVHNIARVAAIAGASSDISQCTAYLDYLSRTSSDILLEYCGEQLGSASGGTLEELNKQMLIFIRNHATDSFQKTFEDAVVNKYSATTTSENANKFNWHYLLANSNFNYPSFADDYEAYWHRKIENLQKVFDTWNNNGYIDPDGWLK